MTVPFWCVAAMIVLPYVLAGLGGYHKTQQLGSVDNEEPRSQTALLTGAGARVAAAQANAWEALVVFGLAVVINHLRGDADPGTSATVSAVYVVARILYTVAYVANYATLRSAVFLVSLACALSLLFV